MSLFQVMRRRRAQQQADAQADLAIAHQERDRYRHALGCALMLAHVNGAEMPDRWRLWASEQWIIGLADRSAADVIDGAIGAGEIANE